MAMSLPVIGMVISGVGTVVSAVSGMQAANYNAAVADRNAQLAERNKVEAIAASQREAQERGLAAKQEIGSLEALMGASGFDLNSGTNLLRRRSLRTLTQQDQMNAREDGNAQAKGFAQQAADFRSESKQTKSSKTFGLFGALATGATSILSDANALRKAREAYA